MVLKYTSATCILYERGDTLGKLLAYVSMAPYIAVMHTLSLVYSRRCDGWSSERMLRGMA